MSSEQTMSEEEKFFFDAAFRQATDALASVLEKPEFNKPKIQNLVMMELAGHIILSMHSAAIHQGLREEIEGSLVDFLGWLAQTMEDGGIATIMPPAKPSAGVN